MITEERSSEHVQGIARDALAAIAALIEESGAQWIKPLREDLADIAQIEHDPSMPIADLVERIRSEVTQLRTDMKDEHDRARRRSNRLDRARYLLHVVRDFIAVKQLHEFSAMWQAFDNDARDWLMGPGIVSESNALDLAAMQLRAQELVEVRTALALTPDAPMAEVLREIRKIRESLKPPTVDAPRQGVSIGDRYMTDASCWPAPSTVVRCIESDEHGGSFEHPLTELIARLRSELADRPRALESLAGIESDAHGKFSAPWNEIAKWTKLS